MKIKTYHKCPNGVEYFKILAAVTAITSHDIAKLSYDLLCSIFCVRVNFSGPISAFEFYSFKVLHQNDKFWNNSQLKTIISRLKKLIKY